MTEKRVLWLILTLFLILGITYAVVTPVFEASDELWHYPMIRHLADGNPLPVQVFDPAQAGPWKQEASQPPLYYYLGAVLTFWIDTADREQVRWLNPHVDNGVITADGNINLAIHAPTFSQWQGTLLAVHIVRIFSVFLSAGTVYLTFRVSSLAIPKRPDIALGAAALNAFMPMFLFISGAVNNDNLAVPLASLALFVMIYWVVQRPSWTSQASLLLGTIIGLALLTKEGTLGLLPLAFGAILVSVISNQYSVISNQYSVISNRYSVMPHSAHLVYSNRYLVGLGRTLIQFVILLIPVLVIAGWWYVRNVQLYGDWLGWNAFIAVLGERAHPASLAQLWDERWGFLLSYWGLFGGVNVPMWTWIYWVLNGVLLVGVGGFIFFGVKEIRDWKLETGRYRLQSLVSNLLLLVRRYFGLVVCLLFSFAVILGLIQWARTTWSSQGRLVFTAVSALNILLAVGLVGWLPQRIGQWVMTAVCTFLFLVAAAAPFVWIRPAYQPHQYTAPWLVPVKTNITFDDKIRLVGYEVGQTAAAQNNQTRQPGDTIDLMLEWEVLATMDRDWSVFVHLNDPVLERPVAQRDMYLDQGLRPTTLLESGEHLFNYYQLRLPETAVAPADLQLTVGLYDFHTLARLPITSRPGTTSAPDAATIAHLKLEPAPGDYPNPVSINFENELELVGFEIEPRRAQPGEPVDLTLYWKAQRPLTTNYTFFAQIVDLETTTRWGVAPDLPQPTADWQVGEVHSLAMPLTVAADTPPDLYPLIIGLYTQSADGKFDRLQMVTEDGRLTDDFLNLTPVRVD
jgi:hypothetical protein